MTVVVLLTLVWTGIWTPDWIEAAVLVSAATFGDEMILSKPWFSAAESAISRLKVSRMLPSRTEATVRGGQDRNSEVEVSRAVAEPHRGDGLRGVQRNSEDSGDVVRKGKVSRVAVRDVRGAVGAPVDAEAPPERFGRLDDPRLDHDLRGGRVEVFDQLEHGRQVGRDLPDYERVGPDVYDDVAAL